MGSFIKDMPRRRLAADRVYNRLLATNINITKQLYNIQDGAQVIDKTTVLKIPLSGRVSDHEARISEAVRRHPMLNGAYKWGRKIRMLAFLSRKWGVRKIPDKYYIAILYRRIFGVFPDLKNPKTFNDKICCRRLYPEAIFSTLADKARVREYVKRKVGGKYLVPHYEKCDSLSLETYHSLPSSFVMKASHGCGYNLVVRDKSLYSYAYLRDRSDRWLASNYYNVSRESHYKTIRPQLIFEKLLIDENGDIPKDFKFYCFRSPGKPPVVFIEVTHDRFKNYKVDYYDTSWELIEVVEDRFTKGEKMAKPEKMDEAIELALQLSEGFSFVRVDLYLLRDAIYFGEITFTPTGGQKRFKTEEINEQWGQLFDR